MGPCRDCRDGCGRVSSHGDLGTQHGAVDGVPAQLVMILQSQIGRRLNESPAQARIVEMLSRDGLESRSALARRLRLEFGCADSRGQLQLSGCLKALHDLAASGALVLPPRQRPPIDTTPVRLDRRVPAPVSVPTRQAAAVQALTVPVVSERTQRQVWNTLIADEHPHGMTTFAGCQLRCLVYSAHGCLGAVGFSAAALRVAARDRWMAWSRAQQDACRDRVICMSRFLVRPSVSCRNPASPVLGRVLRRLPADFEARYGYSLWLVETFVKFRQHASSLKAANFVRVGQTGGRVSISMSGRSGAS